MSSAAPSSQVEKTNKSCFGNPSINMHTHAHTCFDYILCKQPYRLLFISWLSFKLWRSSPYPLYLWSTIYERLMTEIHTFLSPMTVQSATRGMAPFLLIFYSFLFLFLDLLFELYLIAVVFTSNVPFLCI